MGIKGESQTLQANFTREVLNQSKITCKIANNLGPFTNYNIVKRFRESREITVYVGQGWKPQMALHKKPSGVKCHMGSGVLQKTTVCCCIKKCNLNLCYSRRKLYIISMQRCCRILWARAQIVKKTVERCAVLR